MNTQLNLGQALQAHQRGDLAAAEKGYRAVLAEAPDQADALALLGVVLAADKKYQEALELIDRAIELDPSAPLFHMYQGNARMEDGNLEGAAHSFQKAIALKPDMAALYYNLGNVYRSEEKWKEAQELFEKALELDPSHVQARNNLALVFERQNQMPKAIELLKHTVAQAPTYGDGWLNLCNFAEKEKDFDLAHEAGMKAAALMPDNASAWLGLGVALNRLTKDEDALTAYQQALCIRPDWHEVWDNLGQSYQFLARLDEAEDAFLKTIQLAGQEIEGDETRRVDEKEYGNCHWHLALIELLKGKLKLGFARYRSRFDEVSGLTRPDWSAPLWQGEDIAGKTILVIDEQGMGDCLMMARYFPLLKERGARVKIWLHPALIPFFEGWYGVDDIVSGVDTPTDFDVYASLFDLPYIFGTTLETIPKKNPYLPSLKPDEATKLPETGKINVGVVWAGAPLHKHDARRSLPLSVFEELFKEDRFSFFSFNRDKREGDEEILARYGVCDLASLLNNFADAARFMDQMDLIISCDTASAHLAGGMGKKVWTLLPFLPDWRWLMDRDDSPWYPTMKLFRQEKAGDWHGVIGRLRAALRDFSV